MQRNKEWTQCLCSWCEHVNFLPPHGIDYETIHCSNCGNLTLYVPDAEAADFRPWRIVMPKFLMKTGTSSST